MFETPSVVQNYIEREQMARGQITQPFTDSGDKSLLYHLEYNVKDGTPIWNYWS